MEERIRIRIREILLKELQGRIQLHMESSPPSPSALHLPPLSSTTDVVLKDYTKLLNEEMILAFPEMAEMLPPAVKQEPVTNGDTRNGDTSNGDAATGRIDLTLDDSDEVKMEE